MYRRFCPVSELSFDLRVSKVAHTRDSQSILGYMVVPMQLRRLSSFFALTLIALCSCSLSGNAQTSRISQPIDSRRTTALKGNLHPMARAEFDQGALDPRQMIQRVTIFFDRTPAQKQALETLLKEQQDPASANYQKWLTPEQFADRFGISSADLNKVKDWLTGQGFSINEVARGRGWITFSGSAGQIASAFQTELHQYAVNGEVHYANATEPAIPSALSGVVAGVKSLDNFRPRPRLRLRKQVKADFTSSITGNKFVAPDDLARIYNLSGVYAAGLTGSGQKIAVMGQTDIKLTDIAAFRSAAGLSTNVPQVVLVPGSADPGVITDDLAEASLDVEWAGAVARSATIIYVNSKNGVFDSLQYAVNQNLAPVLSISYGDCEPNFSTSEVTFLTNLGQQANAQGQTLVTPSGDDGAADCDYSTTSTPVTSATHGLAVDIPAAMPYSTAIGGTTFSEETGTTYWNSTNNASNGSALYYIPEIAWNDTTFEIANGGSLSASGGGVSTLFTKPSWQVAAGVPTDGMRDVPDISFAASVDHEGYLICSNGDCVNGFRNTDTTLDVVGGTSVGVPIFAGMVALLNQKTGSAQGNVNPRLYALSAAAPYVYHDITSGDNKVPCTANSTGCPSSGFIGYSAGTGYDQVTGLGSVDVYNLVSNWSSIASADFGVEFFDNSLSITRGGSGTTQVIVHRYNGFSGTVALTCSIANVTNATCTVSPNSATPDAAVTLTIATTALSSLQHSPLLPKFPWWESAFGVAAFVGMGAGLRDKRRLLIGLLLLILVFGLASCGGGGGGSSTSKSTGSTGQTGTVTIQATSGSITHTVQLGLTVN